jgi:t-SNARE complex subunit (syntaxin)
MSDEIQTKKVNIELEVDTNTVDSSKNRFQGWIDMAKAVDAWRTLPRLFLTVYIILLYKCVIWYMNLGAPTMEQSGLISIVVGAGAAWFGLYTGTSKK